MAQSWHSLLKAHHACLGGRLTLGLNVKSENVVSFASMSGNQMQWDEKHMFTFRSTCHESNSPREPFACWKNLTAAT